MFKKDGYRQMEEFAIFVNFERHNNYFRPGPRLLYAEYYFKGLRGKPMT